MERLAKLLRREFDTSGVKSQEDHVQEFLVWPAPNYHCPNGFIEKRIEIIQVFGLILKLLKRLSMKVDSNVELGQAEAIKVILAIRHRERRARRKLSNGKKALLSVEDDELASPFYIFGQDDLWNRQSQYERFDEFTFPSAIPSVPPLKPRIQLDISTPQLA